MSTSRVVTIFVFMMGLALGGCVSHPAGNDNNNWSAPDAGWRCPSDSVDQDDDGDGITNFIEGCLEGRNTDGDSLPDWLDTDSDNDGCSDGDEDLNGDGQVGSCGTTCPNLDPAECGPGQQCSATRLCDPPVTPECAGEETDPHNPDTNGDGLLDCVPLTIICEPRSPDNPFGRPVVQFHTSPSGKIQIAVWDQAAIQDQTIVNIGTEDCDNNVDDDNDGAADCDDPDCHNTSHCLGASVTFDLDDPARFAPTAGFAFSRRPMTANVEEERTLILGELHQLFGPGSVTTRSAGDSIALLNQVPSIVQITVTVDTPAPATIPEIRNQLVTTLLHRSPDELINLPTAFFGVSTSEIVISFAIQRRTPAVGEPYVAVMGAVAPRIFYDDPYWMTALDVADVANGTGLAEPPYTRTAECEERVAHLPQMQADILWILDDSNAAQAERANLAASAIYFFNQAPGFGLDFRMGVTNMHEANDGILCTAQGQSNDFFLTPANLSQFQACVLEPWGSLTVGGGVNHGITQGYNAILNHLPRAMAPNRIRPGVSLVVIYFSVEAAEEVYQSCGTSPPWDPTCIQSEIQPTLDLLHGVSNPEAQGTAHAIVGPPPSGCSTAELGGGYVEIATATGGQIISVCQSDLGASLQNILQNIAGSLGHLELNHRPISATLVVARDGSVQQRSRTEGFTYHPVSNTIIFMPTNEPGVTSELVISYERWVAP